MVIYHICGSRELNYLLQILFRFQNQVGVLGSNDKVILRKIEFNTFIIMKKSVLNSKNIGKKLNR
jgi:hypothetical protein